MMKLSKPSRFGFARFRVAGTVLPLLLCGFAATSTLTPQVAHAQNVMVGVVDEDKLADGYKKYKAAVDAIDKRAQNLDSQIPAREHLSDEEGKTFDGLIVKVSPTPAENTQLAALIKSGMDKRATFMGLIGKATRTPEETTQMKALQDQAARNAPALRTTSDNLLATIRQQQDDTDKQYTDRANSVVAQVAADKKFMLIVRKKALVWSAESVDITDEVLKRLNAA
ncbi:Outer membrane protein (OmpH-like) [Abditibacterium utsteinense]|uniref:Outer membrane protein (OmpH-like) n=1 Tax=Abditibacterium utsteinense TaxID=1960156 RepID=A0A2S8SWR0_9BACT|nr:OmpH family outer membrane protein [Abditibacterium utsteinense]PQV65246.1 Outer membrane protein (OmpH-like) [Abditibacterium utsteinense]